MFKPIEVPCLQTLDELKAKCKKLGLRLNLPDHLKAKRRREEDILPKPKKFKIELEMLDDRQLNGLIKTDVQPKDATKVDLKPKNATQNDLQLNVSPIKNASPESQENDRSEASIGNDLIGPFQLNNAKTYTRNKLQTSKLTNGIDNGQLDEARRTNGRLQNFKFNCGQLFNSLSNALPKQIVIIRRLELRNPTTLQLVKPQSLELVKPQNQEPEIIQVDVEPVLYDDEPPEGLMMPEIAKKPRQGSMKIETVSNPAESSTKTVSTVKPTESSVKTVSTVKPQERRENPFFVKETAEQINIRIRCLSNYDAVEERFNFLVELKRYSDELNAHLVKHNNMPILIQNKVDHELPPRFTYTNEYDLSALDKATQDKIEANIQKCSCKHDCEFYLSKNVVSCCYSSYADGCFYTVTGQIKNTNVLSKRGPIVECTKFCACNKKCPNRVIQKGTQVPLAIFKTANGRGWGVKALEKIKKNTYICSYRGQVISSAEALRRQATYELKDRYFFNLDYNEELDFEYVVDATHVSNIGRFLNHSCLPNCETFVAYVESAFLKIPVIAFFTNRLIKKGEELTIDYFIDADYIPSSDKGETKTECLCGSENCKQHPF